MITVSYNDSIQTIKGNNMNHIEFYEKEVSYESGNSVEARIHLEKLQSMPLIEAEKMVSLYDQFIRLKSLDLDILNASRKQQ